MSQLLSQVPLNFTSADLTFLITFSFDYNINYTLNQNAIFLENLL
jgi:hypothetical protein